MDEVLEKFGSLGDQDSTGKSKSNFDGLYKNWGRLGHQEERRKEILEVQKYNRNNKLDRFRGILELVTAVEDSFYWESDKRVHYRPTLYVAGFHKASPTYNNVLMMSEWMIEKPQDFEENWFVVPCPKGVRMLLVSNRGITKTYSKYGQFRFETRTALPGGNPCGGRQKNQPCCVLDGFYDEKLNTMYVLDLLAWNNQPMTDGEAEFRHYWLISQFAEIPDLQVTNKRNQMVFKILPKVSCAKETFNEFMMKYPAFEDHYPGLDGLLFYHKKAHYVGGETPLVGWLYPYMVPEVIGEDVTVNPSYMLGKPIDYVNQAEFIQKFEEKHSKKMKKRGRLSSVSSNMSVTDTKEEDPTKSLAEAGDNNANGAKMDAETTVESKIDDKEANSMEAEDPTRTSPESGDNLGSKMDAEAAVELQNGQNSKDIEESGMEAEALLIECDKSGTLYDK